MADLVVPALGESITEAVISKWLIGVGQHVDADEPVLDLETDKITVQLPAPAAGALSEQRFSVGDTVRVGDVVGQIDTAAKGEGQGAGKAEGQGAAQAANGQGAAQGAAQAADGQGEAPSTGGRQSGARGSARAEAPASEPEPSRPPEPARAEAEPTELAELPERDASGRRLSPAQRRALREGEAPAAPAPAPATRSQPPSAEAGPREEVVPMSPLRKRIAERLVQAQHSSASLTTFNEVDMSAIIQFRKRFQDEFVAAHEVKLGFMSFAVKAAVAALKLFPGVNAEVRGDSIVYKRHYDLGIAVSTEKGLVVPVLRDCDRLGFAEVERGINELARKARESKLVLDDLVGGTFSITNGGIYGSMMSTPLLNYPQTGILGMHNIVSRPVAVGDTVEVRPVMYLALTYDHRVVDGREAVQFLVAVKDRMEHPDRLLFEV